MKKIININLSGRVIPIEDSAYESLQRYIESLRRYFANEEGRDEIINDIESRVAELMSEQIRKGASAITDADIEQIIHSMGRIEDFEEADAAESAASAGTAGTAAGTTATGSTIAGGYRPKQRLYRDANDKLIGGVCSGLANYMNIDPAIVRLIFAIISLGGFGTGFLLYILLWIILPVRSLDTYTGKRLFRNPDDKVLSGVAGGLAAYFNTSSALVRIIFVAPLIINIIFGTLHSIFWMYNHEFFPNFFFGSLTGTFILTYIILWIVLPEAKTPFEKMEMRGEKVDVNRIRQNVKDEMENLKARAQSWSEEVRTSARQMEERARAFANTRGRTFAGEVAEVSRPVASGIGHVIGTIFKAFFLLIAGAIALAFFAILMALIFGGVAWWPINNFLWTSNFQKAMAWGTVFLFIAVPLVGFIVWLIRRIAGVRRRNSYLGWTFGGLWTIGWFCAIFFAISISKDLRTYERVGTDVPVTQPAHDRMIVKVNEPEIHNSENIWWLHTGGNGLDVTADSMRYNNAKLRVEKSSDSDYHVTVYRYSAGSNYNDAQARASKVRFNVSSQDSILNLGSGLAIGSDSKFRGQAVIVDIQVPVGKKIRFDDSILDAYDSWMVRKPGYSERRWRRYSSDWDNDEGFEWTSNVDYVMGKDGELTSTVKRPNADNTNNDGNDDENTTVPSRDSLQLLRDEQRRVRDSIDHELKRTEQELRHNKNPKPVRTSEEVTTQLMVPNVALLVI